ncbi:cation diffusion facilitator family transporter [Phormidium sp. CCY1219]|uniref:cation diffusion facilitator family transporter n=1 Tax=Phormidium sp. CCY1219 TaxID=2886104 RepID=UPI002D1E89EF|nr:cation diffusion facilitator family transporter [Phormidium sp. CCY1219]MEB3830735.1 cation diffusion facilitator family transporter [Phormidium sp. CCY1219]
MATDNRAEVRKVLLITLALNLVVMAIKAVVGTLTGSLSLLADALHSVTDSANNVLGLVTNHWASPQPDREHPYGHQKFDALGALGIAAFLGVACFEILQGAVDRIFSESKSVNISPGQLWILLVVLGINIFVAFYERRVGQRIGSSILVADAKHTMSDVWVTILVIAGLIGVWQGRVHDLPELQWLDIVLAFPVALLVFRSGWEVLQENLPWLVDEVAIAPEAVHAIAMQVPEVINCHDIASRGMVGRQVFIEMHMVVDAHDVKTAHEITEKVEALLSAKFSPARILIHIEPPSYQSESIGYASNPDRKPD